ncbi:hypothetical protein AALP_AA4G032800 [Arabis alpina]|uniref:NAC domain-containing protein n=1 Tax=Arabis alpina TaxID=50452 RepID=A0A087H0V8_ARAAL|nr:hypothetical protein AALP_AA4G032800 [Arabis alpina]
MGIQETDPLAQLSLPPGFRFFPTDEELMVQYLCRKAAGYDFSLQLIAEIDLYKFDPWVLPNKAIFGEKEWYFFSPRDRKYPNGSRPNRVAGSGYWKATGTDKIISTEGQRVGIKKALVFYIGKAPKGTKTNWIMHEYRLIEPSRRNGSSKLDDWVLCRIYKKQSSAQKQVYDNVITSTREFSNNATSSTTSSSSHFEDVLDSLHRDIDNRNFQFSSNSNQLSSIRPELTEQKTEFVGTSSYDWATSIACNSEHNSSQELGMSHVVPNLELNYGFLKTEEEFNNSNELVQKGYGVDSVGFGYSGQVGGFGFM